MTGWEWCFVRRDGSAIMRRLRGRSEEELQGVDRKDRGWGWAQLGTESPD